MFARSKILLLLLTITVAAHGQTGTTGMSFLKIGVGARALAMGEAFSAIASDPSATFYNPAALSLSTTPQVLLMHKAWIEGTRTEFIGATTASGRFAFGISANSTSVNDIELRTTPGPPLATFDARNAAIGFSAAYAIQSGLSVGLTGKFLYEKIYIHDASGFAFDLGGLYTTPWDFTFALGLQNLGSLSELDRESSTLPAAVRAGAGYQRDLEEIESRLILSSDLLSFTTEGETHVHFGAEFSYKDAFSVRAGYMTGYEARGISAGVGFAYDIVAVDYAFVPFSYDFGATHTFSVGINFR